MKKFEPKSECTHDASRWDSGMSCCDCDQERNDQFRMMYEVVKAVGEMLGEVGPKGTNEFGTTLPELMCKKCLAKHLVKIGEAYCDLVDKHGRDVG